MGKWRGPMTKRRMERLKQEGLMSEEESLEYQADLILESDRTSRAHQARKRQVKVDAVKALSDEEVREKLRFTQADIQALNDSIHSPARHAQTVQSGLKLKALVNGLLDKEGGGAGSVNVVVNTIQPYSLPEGTTSTSLPGKTES